MSYFLNRPENSFKVPKIFNSFCNKFLTTVTNNRSKVISASNIRIQKV